MTLTSRLKVDAKRVYQQSNWITVADYFGTPPADWVHGYLYFEPGAWIWIKGFRRYSHIVKNLPGNVSLDSTRVRALGWPLLGIFSGFFWFFWGGSVGQTINREYIVFRAWNIISCSLASCLNFFLSPSCLQFSLLRRLCVSCLSFSFRSRSPGGWGWGLFPAKYSVECHDIKSRTAWKTKNLKLREKHGILTCTYIYISSPGKALACAQ